jgi:hypothetical protein
MKNVSLEVSAFNKKFILQIWKIDMIYITYQWQKVLI